MRSDYLLYRDSCVQNRAIAIKYELKFTRLNNLRCFFCETRFSEEGLARKTSFFQQKLDKVKGRRRICVKAVDVFGFESVVVEEA